jgi:hypothetical protein
MKTNVFRTIAAVSMLFKAQAAQVEDTAKVQWLSTHMAGIHSIVPNDDYRDLEPLKKLATFKQLVAKLKPASWQNNFRPGQPCATTNRWRGALRSASAVPPTSMSNRPRKPT